MKALSDEAIFLDANFSLERTKDGFDLVLESWSGPRPDGTPPRNPDYNDTLELLFMRLKQVEADLSLGIVDSREMQGRSLEDRRLDLPNHRYPISLVDIASVREFRLELGRAQRVVGRAPGTHGGNNTKQIRLSLAFPSPWSVGDLGSFLVRGMSDLIPDPADEEAVPDTIDPTAMSALWDRYRNANPIVKERISRHIERGPAGSMVKKVNNYRCQICDSLKQPWISFVKPNGSLYIEAHHVVPVSALGVGVLGPANIVTVCPNHHRQLHFGRVDITDAGDTFSFMFNGGEPVIVQKFRPPEP